MTLTPLRPILALIFLAPLTRGQDLAALSRLTDAESRSISAENPTGEKGQGARATEGVSRRIADKFRPGWKVSPCMDLAPGQTLELARIEGPGAIKHLWMVPVGNWRDSILRMQWDGEDSPSVEVPVGDFFAVGWGGYAVVSSLAVCVNPNGGLNCYWNMPFRHSARITMENRGAARLRLYFQIDYERGQQPADAGYFHAQFRRMNPAPAKQEYPILDGVRGRGQYVGTYLAWGSLGSFGWWGEGEMKFFLDGDAAHPTICGTGTEDYFGGAHDFINPNTGEPQSFSSPYSGLPQVIKAEPARHTGPRFGMYRWHLTDPVRFTKDLRVTMQVLGSDHGHYIPVEDDIASVAYWYQAEPHAPFPALPDRGHLEIEGGP